MFQIKDLQVSPVNNITRRYDSSGRLCENWDIRSYQISYKLEEKYEKFDVLLEISLENFKRHASLHSIRIPFSFKEHVSQVVKKYEMINHQNISEDSYLFDKDAKRYLKEYGYAGLQMRHIKCLSKTLVTDSQSEIESLKLKECTEFSLYMQNLMFQLSETKDQESVRTLTEQYHERSKENFKRITELDERLKKLQEHL
jgi:hypothetical protein